MLIRPTPGGETVENSSHRIQEGVVVEHSSHQVQERLHEIQEILMKQYARSDPILYHINKAIEIFNREARNGKDWKVPSVHHSLRRPLTEEERDRLLYLATELRMIEVSPYLRYYVSML